MGLFSHKISTADQNGRHPRGDSFSPGSFPGIIQERSTTTVRLTRSTMRKDELVAVFDQQAERYDAQWEGMAPIREGLYLLVESVFAGLPDDARILCVGVGTGAELATSP